MAANGLMINYSNSNDYVHQILTASKKIIINKNFNRECIRVLDLYSCRHAGPQWSS